MRWDIWFARNVDRSREWARRTSDYYERTIDRSGTSRIHRAQSDVEAISGSVLRRREDPNERAGLPDAAAAGAGRGVFRAAEPGVLRELYRLDCGLVRGHVDAP